LAVVSIGMVFVLAGAISTTFADPVEDEMKKDVVLRALVEELDRNKAGLKLEDLQPPYFVEYELIDSFASFASAELGAVIGQDDRRSRWLRADTRVGSYELDNTNFRGQGGMGGFGGASMPVEDDLTAIRQAIWWATDRQYKEAVEQLAEKKAFMAGRLIEDKPNDFSREQPQIHFEDHINLAVDAGRLEALAVPLSAIFRGTPEIKESSVSVSGAAGHKYLVNTEGTRMRTSHRRFSLNVKATVQADDGMELSASLQHDGRSFESLPTLEELTKECQELAEELVALKKAPVLEAYTGPVLFEAEAAASLFQRFYAPRFAGGQRPVGSRTHPEDFANKLNKRILPRFVNVIDDSTQETIHGHPAMGFFRFDDQGVKAKPVTLVENGRLLSLLMSRNPSKEFTRSTGHGRGPFAPRPAYGCLVVSASQTLDSKSLREELLESVQDEGLPFGIRIAALGGGEGSGGGQSPGGGASPLLIYKIYSDGREERARGAEFARIDLKSFKRMLALGDKPYVLNGQGAVGQTIVAPAMLFEELDLAKVDRDFDRPPILPSPVARAAK